MTVRPVITALALDRADANLAAAIKTNGTPPCWEDPDAWSDFLRFERDPITPLDGCAACPVFAECSARAGHVARRDLANTITAGVRYDVVGRPTDMSRQYARHALDQRLAQLAGLVA